MEYAHNLQQQIYFLELECQYLRMNGPAAGEGAKGQGTSNGMKGLPMSFTNQLQHIKDTYDQMEQAQNSEISDLKLKLDSAHERDALLNGTIESLREDIREKTHLIEVFKQPAHVYYTVQTHACINIYLL